jgi:hypothetical protein
MNSNNKDNTASLKTYKTHRLPDLVHFIRNSRKPDMNQEPQYLQNMNSSTMTPQACFYHGHALQPFNCMICSMIQMKLSTEMPGTSDFAFSFYPAPGDYLLADPVDPYHYNKPAVPSFDFNYPNPVADMFKPAVSGLRRSWIPIGAHDNGCESLALSPTLGTAMMLDEDHADDFALSDDEEPLKTQALRRKGRGPGKKQKFKKQKEVEVLATPDDEDHPKVKLGRGLDKSPRKRKVIGQEERQRLQELMEKIQGILGGEDPEVILGDEEPEVILGDEEPISPCTKVPKAIQLIGEQTCAPQGEDIDFVEGFTELEVVKKQVLPRTRSRRRQSWLPPKTPAEIDPPRRYNFREASDTESEVEIVKIVKKQVLPHTRARRRPYWLPPKTPSEMDPLRGRKRKVQADDEDDKLTLRRSTRLRR